MTIRDRQWLPGTKVPTRRGRPHGPPAATGWSRAPGTPSPPVATGLRTLLVSLPAQVDESNAAQVRATLMAAADRRPRVLIADMSGIRWCDWAGAGALASTFCRAATAGTELRLVLTDEAVLRVIRLNGLDQLLPIFEDVTTAAAAAPGS